MTISQIGQIAVTVEDLARAVDFYRDRLGLPFLFQASGMAFFDCGATRLLLGEREGADGPWHSSILYFKVGDIEQVSAELKQSDVHFVQEPHLAAEMDDHELWLAFFEDSEGNTMALMSEVR